MDFKLKADAQAWYQEADGSWLPLIFNLREELATCAIVIGAEVAEVSLQIQSANPGHDFRWLEIKNAINPRDFHRFEDQRGITCPIDVRSLGSAGSLLYTITGAFSDDTPLPPAKLAKPAGGVADISLPDPTFKITRSGG